MLANTKRKKDTTFAGELQTAPRSQQSVIGHMLCRPFVHADRENPLTAGTWLTSMVEELLDTKKQGCITSYREGASRLQKTWAKTILLLGSLGTAVVLRYVVVLGPTLLSYARKPRNVSIMYLRSQPDARGVPLPVRASWREG